MSHTFIQTSISSAQILVSFSILLVNYFQLKEIRRSKYEKQDNESN